MQPVIIDTNVPKVANQKSSQASPTCVQICIGKIRDTQQGHHLLVLDNQWVIIKEYMRELHESGQPGIGDAFLKWVLTNWMNPNCCELISITPQQDDTFVEFPQDRSLQSFDPSDRKFVATALAHPNNPPILIAIDRGWRRYRHILATFGVQITFLCPDTINNPKATPIQIP